MYNPYSLEEKNILVTGASSGIGQATAIECSKMGARVIITARNEERLRVTLQQMEGEGHKMIVCNLADMASVERLVAQVDKVDGFVSNAGINKSVPISFMKQDDIDEIFKVNTISPMILLKKLLKKKKINKGGAIVYTSSIAGMGVAGIGNGIYTATKGAISSFVKVAALELAPKKIRVNAVCPGMVQTPLIYDGTFQDEELEKDMERYPLGTFGKPEDIAFAIIYLLSDASRWVTGTNLIIDGGLTIR